MASDFEKWVLEENLTAEVADCLVYEARKRLDSFVVLENPPSLEVKAKLRHEIFRAFTNLGKVKAILGNRFEKVKQEL